MLPTDPLFTNCIFHVLKLEQQLFSTAGLQDLQYVFPLNSNL